MRLKTVCLVALLPSAALIFMYFYCLIHDLNTPDQPAEFAQFIGDSIAWATICWAIQVVTTVLWMTVYGSEKSFYSLCVIQCLYLLCTLVLFVMMQMVARRESLNFASAVLVYVYVAQIWNLFASLLCTLALSKFEPLLIELPIL